MKEYNPETVAEDLAKAVEALAAANRRLDLVLKYADELDGYAGLRRSDSIARTLRWLLNHGVRP